MLPISTGKSSRYCDGLTRRSFLQAGALGLGGLTLADMLRLKSEGAIRSKTEDTSVILFWLSGGPGHMETWDPKPDAPIEYRGPLGAISTNTPGVQFGELMPQQAEIMDKMAIVRTVNHGSGDHTKGNHWMLTGFEGPAFNAPDNRMQRRPAMGSVAARLRGPNQKGMPPYVGVPHLRGGTDNLFHYATYLGGGFNPFVVNSDPNDRKYKVRNLSLPKSLSLARLEDRREILTSLDSFKHRLEKNMTDLSEHQQNAFELLTSKKIADAFNISAENEKIRDSYGRHTFGQSALLARRLVERGVAFVTVNCVPWDHHGSPGQYKTEEGAKKLIPPMDRAVAALIGDLTDRGMAEKTLVVAMGEFGRTPRMNKNAGRDHWGRTFSVAFGGGGMKMGQVIGRSTARGEAVAERPFIPADIASTVYHHLGIDAHSTYFLDHLDRPLPLLDTGAPIRELIG